MPAPQDLPGRFIKQGRCWPTSWIIVASPCGRSSLNRISISCAPGTPAEIRLAERVEDCYRAGVARLVPSAVSELPHAALGSEGGGVVPVDPTDAEVCGRFNVCFRWICSSPGGGFDPCG